LNLAIGSLRKVNRSHPACAQNANSPIGSPMRGLRRVRVEAQKGFYFGAQLRTDLAFNKEFLTLALRQIGDLMEKKAHDRIHRVSKLRNVGDYKSVTGRDKDQSVASPDVIVKWS